MDGGADPFGREVGAGFRFVQRRGGGGTRETLRGGFLLEAARVLRKAGHLDDLGVRGQLGKQVSETIQVGGEFIAVIDGHVRGLVEVEQMEQAGSRDLLVACRDHAIFKDGDSISSSGGTSEGVVGVPVHAEDGGRWQAVPFLSLEEYGVPEFECYLVTWR